jgi:hypothetical protein
MPTGPNGNGHHPLRERPGIYLLTRQHQLDPAPVKAYAADYCDVSELRQASREQVSTITMHLAEYAQGVATASSAVKLLSMLPQLSRRKLQVPREAPYCRSSPKPLCRSTKFQIACTWSGSSASSTGGKYRSRCYAVRMAVMKPKQLAGTSLSSVSIAQKKRCGPWP